MKTRIITDATIPPLAKPYGKASIPAPIIMFIDTQVAEKVDIPPFSLRFMIQPHRKDVCQGMRRFLCLRSCPNYGQRLTYPIHLQVLSSHRCFSSKSYVLDENFIKFQLYQVLRVESELLEKVKCWNYAHIFSYF